MKRRVLPPLLLICSLIPMARATTIEPLTFSQVVQDASAIVLAKVATSEVRRDAPDKLWATHYELKVLEVLKGEVNKPLKLQVAGGRYGESVAMVHGLLHLDVGETYILALHDDFQAVGNPYVGVNQGWFQVLNDPSTGTLSVLNGDGNIVMGVENGLLQLRFGEVNQSLEDALASMPQDVPPPVPDDGSPPPPPAEGLLARQAYFDVSRVGMTPTDFMQAIRAEAAGE